MAKERVPMRKVREILRMRWELKLSVREVAKSLGVSVGVVSKVANRAHLAGLDWASAQPLSEAELEVKLYGAGTRRDRSRPAPDPVWIHAELRRAGVTLELLHLEYLEQHPTGLRYTAFCDVYRGWLSTRGLSMRQVHKAGEKCFVDYSGKKPCIVDPETGQKIEVELFVAVLGASGFVYAEATRTQRSADFIGSHNRAFEEFGGVPRMVVPDQLRSAVSSPCRYEPGIQRTYAEWARHYHTAVVPARPGKPRDKAKVEVAVQVVQRWILARLRHEVFFSLEALNARIRDLTNELNARPMRRLGGQTRCELFARYDRPALLPLPEARFEYAEWKQATVNVDYHVELDRHWYSVPHPLVHKRVELRATASTVEVLHGGQRVASHVRSHVPYRHTTDPAHMPEAHRRHFRGADAVLGWASSVGPMTEAMVQRLLEQNPIREVGWRSARGLQRVGERYGAERTELACTRALALGARSYKTVARILALGRERMPLPGEETPEEPTIHHENVRGPDYYH